MLLQIQGGLNSFPKHLKWDRTPRLLHHSAGALWRAPSVWKPALPWKGSGCLSGMVLSDSSTREA